MSDSSPPQDKIDPEHFCYYPFTQLLLQPTGAISPCCWNQAITLGKVPEQTLEEIWNGPALRQLRKEFLEGRPVSCQQQIRHIRCHKWSRRDDSHKLELSEIMSGAVRRLDLRLNGKCNLQCVMCDVWKQPNGIYDQSDFWTKGPETIFPFLKEIDVLGGEPFVQTDTFRLIDAVSAVNPNCSWAFVTNGSYKFNDALKRRLDKIQIRWLQVSLDSVDPATYARVRIGGNLKKTLTTLQSFVDYRTSRERPFELLITMCVQRLNWREIEEFLEFGRSMKVNAMLQFAFTPHSVSLLSLPESERREILQYLERLGRKFEPGSVQSVYSPLKDSLMTASHAELVP